MAEGSTKVVLAALGGNLMIALTKFVASAMTGSAAMFSEAIHSVVDSGNQMLLLYGIRRARRPPTPQHPFGHGREVYSWSFVVAVLLFGIGAGLSVYDGWHALSHPEPVESPWVNFAVLGFAAALLAYESRGLLIGESADRSIVDGIRRIFVEAESLRARRGRQEDGRQEGDGTAPMVQGGQGLPAE